MAQILSQAGAENEAKKVTSKINKIHIFKFWHSVCFFYKVTLSQILFRIFFVEGRGNHKIVTYWKCQNNKWLKDYFKESKKRDRGFAKYSLCGEQNKKKLLKVENR